MQITKLRVEEGAVKYDQDKFLILSLKLNEVICQRKKKSRTSRHCGPRPVGRKKQRKRNLGQSTIA